MSSTTNVLHEPVEINVSSLETSATRLVCLIKPTWVTKTLIVKNLGSDKNNNYYSIVPNDLDEEEHPVHGVVLKLYPDNSDVYFDHSIAMELVNQLAQHGVALHVVLTFQNGYLSNFVPGRKLMPNEEYAEELIAQKLAAFHSIPLRSDYGSHLVQQLRKFADLLMKRNPALHDRLSEIKEKETNVNASFLTTLTSSLGFSTTNTLTIDQIESQLKDTSWAELSTEIDFIRTVFEDHCSKRHLPMVLCLNNLNPNNFVYDAKSKTTSIIDFDHCSHNYFLLDIVSYFIEITKDNPKNKYPSRQVQKSFLKEYLKNASLDLSNCVYDRLKPTDAELEKLCDLCGLLIAPVHLYWALWSFLQALLLRSTTSSSFIVTGKNHLVQYQTHKANFFLPLYNNTPTND